MKIHNTTGARIPAEFTKLARESKPLTLKVFRERVQSGQFVDKHEWGGCGCALDDGTPGEQP
jgi:hypothetical protein